MASPNRADVTVTWPSVVSGQLKNPSTIRIRQFDYNHDMAVLEYYVESAVQSRYKEGTPIKIQWGKPPNDVETYYGSVLFIRPHVANERHLMRVVCIGTSYKTRGAGSPDAHTEMTIEHYFSMAAKKYRFDLVRPKAGLKWPQLVRTSRETEWEHLCRLAKRVGYTFYVNKTTMFLYDPVKVLLDNYDAWPMLRYYYGRQSDFQGDIVSFTPFLGDQGTPGREKRGKTISSVDPRSGAILSAYDSGTDALTIASHVEAPRFGTALTGQPVHSAAEARVRVEGMWSDKRWIVKAEAHCYGNVRLRQGTGVHINGVSKESDGLWYVGGTEHVLTFENHPAYAKYFTDLTLFRDGREQDFHPDPTVPRQRSTLAAVGVQRKKRTASAVYDGGFWVSSNPQEVVLA